MIRHSVSVKLKIHVCVLMITVGITPRGFPRRPETWEMKMVVAKSRRSRYQSLNYDPKFYQICAFLPIYITWALVKKVLIFRLFLQNVMNAKFEQIYGQ